MIRLASKSLIRYSSLCKQLPISKLNHFSLAYDQIQFPSLKQASLFSAPKFTFSRKKRHGNINDQFEQELDQEAKQLKQQIDQAYRSREQKLSIMRFVPFIAFTLLAIAFSKAHLVKRQDNLNEQNGQPNIKNERRNVTMFPEIGLRQLIAKGDLMSLKIQIVRRNRSRGSNQYVTYCFFKRANGQYVAAQIANTIDFLTFVENMPYDFKVSFEYESLRNVQSTLAWVDKIIKITFFAALFFVGRRLVQNAKKLMKGSGQNPLDFDTKKIEAIKPQNIKTVFKDVAGMHQAKFQITEFVDFLKQPQKYIEMGAKVPKGALLTGPPGTGKTLLARACAGQAGVPFYYVSGSDFVEKYVGLGASRVRKLFDEAEKNAPSIIFIDQIDAIGKKRDSGPFANQQRDNTLNQLLVRMDGFETKNKVIVMAATNIKDTLDPALLRPGRFDRSVEIGLPNFEERKQILQVHLKKVKFDPKFTIEELANRISILTPGFSGAQLANICNEAAILAAREGAQTIDMPKFEKATERVMAGLEKRNLFSEDEKIMLAYYESGKAVVGWFTQGSDPIIKLSIVPFSKASKGYSHTIKDEIGLTTKEDLIGKVCFYLGGRASQLHFQKYVTTNGDTDLKRAKRIITLLVTKFGMSQKLKHIAFPDIEFVRKPYSTQIQMIIDSQIKRISDECIARVEKLIEEKKDLIEALKIKLLQKETLNHNDIKEILGERPFASTNENYQKYVIEEQKAHQQNPNEKGELLKQQHENQKVAQNQSKADEETKKFKPWVS